MNLKRILSLLLLLWVSNTPAASVQMPHVEVELVAENRVLAAGTENWLALRLQPEAGWHVYWRNPGDSGLPTQLNWTLPAGFSTGEIHWPYPHEEKLGELTNYGYGHETLHLVPLQVPADWVGKLADVQAEAKWLVCKDICIPGKTDLSLSLPVAATAEPNAQWAPRFAQTRTQLPQPAEWPARFSTEGGELRLALSDADLVGAKKISFFAFAGDLVAHAQAQRWQLDSSGAVQMAQLLSPYFAQKPDAVEGVLVVEHAESVKAYQIKALPGSIAALPAVAATKASEEASLPLLMVLLFALIGGLILNLMPCVFPVLSLKAISLMQSRDVAHAHRKHALSYTAGVVLSCVAVAGLLLSLRAGGEAIGWGFQLQSPVFVALLAYLMFALGLSLSGAAEFGAGLMGVGQALTQKSGLAGSFFTGVLATVVASPCTAPFMGTALGYAVTQPPAVALLIFVMLGLGLALPFLAMGFFPGLAHVLPRPGAWMETFKQVMAFPLYLTVVWLTWVVARQSGPNAAGLLGLGLVLIAFALWLWRRAGLVPLLLRYSALLLALALLTRPALYPAAEVSKTATADSEAWSAERLAQLRTEGKTVFVNFTADWCITCKVNERIAINDSSVRAYMQEQGIAWLTADWTREDPAITAELAKFGRNGVPLYLVYQPGVEAAVLPQLLTPAIVLEALRPQGS